MRGRQSLEERAAVCMATGHYWSPAVQQTTDPEVTYRVRVRCGGCEKRAVKGAEQDTDPAQERRARTSEVK